MRLSTMSCKNMIAPAQWIKKNMLGTYSEELGRPLTEAEMRVQRCLEQLSVPEWYRKHSKPTRILQNGTPFECRPASWKTIKLKNGNSPRKSPWKRSPKKTENDGETHITISNYQNHLNETYTDTSRNQSLINDETYIGTPKNQTNMNETYTDNWKNQNLINNETYIGTPKNQNNMNETYIDRSRNESLLTDEMYTTTNDTFLNETHIITLPDQKSLNETYRISRKTPRKSYPLVESSFESESEPPKSLRKFHSPLTPSNTFPRVTPSRKIQNINIVLPNPTPPKCSRTVYTTTKNIEMIQEPDQSTNEDATHASFLIAEIEPDGVKTKVHVFAGPEEFERVDSPNTRFFNSSRKSTELERIVQSGLRDSGSSGRSLIQEMIGELDRTLTEGRYSHTGNALGDEAKNFVKSMVSALEQSDTDTELPRSTSISFEDTSDESDEEVYWIPAKIRQLPRTSSLLSMLSKGSSRRSNGRASPGLSPIKKDKKKDWHRPWGLTYTDRNNKLSRQLFRIDETGVIDSGYSDRSSSRTATISSTGETRRSSPTSSLSSSPTFFDGLTDRITNSRPCIFKSFLV